MKCKRKSKPAFISFGTFCNISPSFSVAILRVTAASNISSIILSFTRSYQVNDNESLTWCLRLHWHPEKLRYFITRWISTSNPFPYHVIAVKTPQSTIDSVMAHNYNKVKSINFFACINLKATRLGRYEVCELIKGVTKEIKEGHFVIS